MAYVHKDVGRYHTVAPNRADAAFVRYAVEHPLLPGRGSLIGRTAPEKRAIHVEDEVALLVEPWRLFRFIRRFSRR